jgi:predicted Zn-dependent protease
MTNDARPQLKPVTAVIGRHVSILSICLALIGALLLSTPANATSQGIQSSTAQQIDALKTRTKQVPSDSSAWIGLGAAYTTRAYETGDPSFYPLADGAFQRAEKLSPTNAYLWSGKAFLALARHRFGDARTFAKKGLVIAPTLFDAQLALADAEIELGSYEAAEVLVDALVNQRPGVASLSRLSYVRQLRGDLVGAEAAMRSAAASAPKMSLERSIVLGYLGEILLERGKGDAARREFGKALVIDPSSTVATMGMATLHAEAGQWGEAAALLSQLSERVPIPGVFGLQADIARASGDKRGERTANQLVDATVDLFIANGAVVDSELAVLLADRTATQSTTAVALARKAYGERSTVFTADALAWALFKAGQPKEALPFAKQAVSRKPGVAAVRWHAAAIFAANGETASARNELTAVLPNRWFSPTQRIDVASLATRLGVK